MCVYFFGVCLVPSPEDLEEEAIQQQPKASYDSVSDTEKDRQPIPMSDKDPIAVQVSDEDIHEINSS